MKKKFIKLNNNDNNLSLGNVIRYIKLLSNNKKLATQTEIFCIIFDVYDVNDSTVNNYCIGYRSIGSNYKDIFYNYKRKMEKDEYVLVPTIINIIGIMESNTYSLEDNKTNIDIINNNINFKILVNNLYNVAKNDNDISVEFINNLKDILKNKNYYRAFVEILFYAILDKKQPIYIDNIVKNAIETLINNTNISINDLENFLNVEFMDGINYTYKIKQMANANNPYALFNLAMMEYNGEFSGYARYNICFDYLKRASVSGHPRANFMIAYLIYNKKIGTFSDDDLNLAWNHLNIAKDAGSIAAINTMGLAYLKGLVPGKKIDVNKALYYFKEASNYDYSYAYNNLGKIYEERKEYDIAFDYYLKSANLEESWACNKIGYFYYYGIGVNKNFDKSFYYFNKGCDAPLKNQCYWNKYNLAKNFYLNGRYEANVEKDIDKALSLLMSIENNLIEAAILLFYIAIDSKDNVKILYYKDKIEKFSNYNNNIKKDIEDKLAMFDNKIELKKIINV